MRHLRRILVVLLLLVAFFVTAVVVCIRVLPETDLIRSRVQDQLSNLTGQTVTLGSLKISWSFPRLISLNVKGLSIASRDGKKLVSADRLIIIPSLALLLKKEVVVESVTIQGMRAAIRRSPNGAIAGALFPVPATSPQKKALKNKPEQGGSELTVVSDGEGSSHSKPAQGLKFSINEIKFVDGRVDWIDEKVAPGKAVERSLKQISGFLKRKASGNVISANITGRLANGQPKDHSVHIQGQATLAEDLTGLEGIAMDVSSDSLGLKPFYVYLPHWADLARQFDNAAVRTHVTWEKGDSAKIALKTDLKVKSRGSAHVNVRGDIIFAQDLSTIQIAQASAETDTLPLAIFKSSFPRALPLDPETGTVKAAIKGEWKAANNWTLHGTVGLENVAPTGVYRRIAPKVSLWAQASLNPEQLLIDNMEIRETGKLASVTGRISAPFLDKRAVDLQGDISMHPEWLKDFGVQLPKALHVKGDIPIRWRARGRPQSLWLDMQGDITAVAIQWAPFFEKPSGNKANISVKGTFFPWRNQKTLEPAIVNVGMMGSRVRFSPKSPWASGLAMRLDSKVLLKLHTADLKDTSMVIRRATESADMLMARTNFTDLGSADPKIDGRATLAFNPATIALAGFKLPSGAALTGNVPLKAKFAGSPTELTWSLELPLTHLDVKFEHAFRKQGGVAGSLTATGKLSGQQLDLTNARLTLPGLLLTGRGLVRDRNGNFQEVTLDMKRTDLKDLLRYLPSMVGTKLSGPAEGTIRLSRSDKGVIPAGFVRLLGVNYRQDNAGWGLTKIKGTVETASSNAEIPELTGTIQGPIEGPLKVKGWLKDVASLDKMNGKLTMEVGKGRIRADHWKRALKGVQVLVGTLLDPQALGTKNDLLEFQSIAGDIHLKSGTASTDNLRLRGAEVNAAAIGSLRLNPSQLDLITRIQTMTVVGNVLGKIPAVQKFVKKHEDLLKITGLGKELKRFGIGVPDAKESKQETTEPARTPVTVVLKIHGPTSSPEVSPVLETALDKSTLSRLKSLMN
jgi:AsmA-like C-terminal region/AsmA family